MNTHRDSKFGEFANSDAEDLRAPRKAIFESNIAAGGDLKYTDIGAGKNPNFELRCVKVLVVKIGALGDVIMALPLLNYLKEQKADITWLCDPAYSELLDVDHLIYVSEKKLVKGSFFQQVYELFLTWFKLGIKRFDLIITAYRDPRYKLLSLFCIGKRKILGKYTPGIYSPDEYLKLVSEQKAEFPKTATVTKHNIVALAPGGGETLSAQNRKWPIENYVEVAKELLKMNYEVIITGSPSDSWVNEHFKDINVSNLVGKTSLKELIELYQKCKLVITHDSGSLHLAVLANAQILALFGPVNPVERIKNQHVIWGGESLTCRPCYDGKYFADCTTCQCMKDISSKAVITEVGKILSM